jgi:twitching motility protein PilT
VDRTAHKAFRDAAWASPDEVRNFVAASIPFTRKDVELLLATLTEPALDKNTPHHKNRCAAFRALMLAAPDPANFLPIASALPTLDPQALRAIAGVLPRLNDSEAHAPLCAALGCANTEARATARVLLEALGGPSALRALTDLVREPRFEGRLDAMTIMVPKARHRTISLLAAVLSHGRPNEQIEAIRWLSDPEMMAGAPADAARALERALDAKEPRVAEAAFRAFAARVDEARFFEVVEPRVMRDDVLPAIVQALAALRSARGTALLRTRLRRGPTLVQIAALRALEEIAGGLGGNAVMPAFLDALAVDDPGVQRASADALTRLAERPDVDAAQLFIALLRSPHAHVRRVATNLAGRIRSDERLANQVFDEIKGEDWWSRERVLEALVELGVPRVGERLMAHLEDESPLVRRFAIFGLLRLRDPRTLPALLAHAASDDDWWVREQAVSAIAELGDPRAIPYLRALVSERWDLRVAALDALESMQAEDDLLDLAELTSDEDPQVVLAMLEILGRHPNGRQASLYVQGCVGADEPRVAKKARELLDGWKLEGEATGSASVGLRDRLLVSAARGGADDVLLGAGRPPYQKRHGDVSPIAKASLSAAEIDGMLLPMLKPAQREALGQRRDVDLSYEVPGFDMRFRVNVFREAPGLAAVFRKIEQKIPPLETLGLPSVIASFADFPNGLVLVGGPTGSGKSTTLAALIDHINSHHGKHIVTIEDPIEVMHRSKEAMVNQREVGTHARSFADALRATVRQDPDVLLVGELRDQETIEIAVNAAETGHLVFATVHANSAAAAVDRLVHALPAKRQALVRSMLAESLRAVLCQQLLHRKDDPKRRALACEVMISNDAIANLIRSDKSFQINGVIMTNRAAGMQLMDSVLEEMVRGGVIEPDEAYLKSVDKGAFARMLDAFRGSPEAARAADSGTALRPDRSSMAPGAPASVPPSARATGVGIPAPSAISGTGIAGKGPRT